MTQTQTEQNRKDLLEQNLDKVIGYYTLREILDIEKQSISRIKNLRLTNNYSQPKILDEYIYDNLVTGLEEIKISNPVTGKSLYFNEEPFVKIPKGTFEGMTMPSAYWQKYFSTEQGTYLFYLITTGNILMPDLPWGLGDFPQTNINMYDYCKYLNWMNQVKNPHLFSPKDNEVLYYIVDDNRIFIDVEAMYLPGVQRLPFVEEYNRVAETVRKLLSENVHEYVDDYCLYRGNTNGIMPERHLIENMIKPCPETGLYNIFGGTWPTTMGTGVHNPYNKDYRKQVEEQQTK